MLSHSVSKLPLVGEICQTPQNVCHGEILSLKWSVTTCVSLFCLFGTKNTVLGLEAGRGVSGWSSGLETPLCLKVANSLGN